MRSSSSAVPSVEALSTTKQRMRCAPSSARAERTQRAVISRVSRVTMTTSTAAMDARGYPGPAVSAPPRETPSERLAPPELEQRQVGDARVAGRAPLPPHVAPQAQAPAQRAEIAIDDRF